MLGRPPKPPEERLANLSRLDMVSGCVLFTGPRTNSGYGKFQLDMRSRLAHRVSWELSCGPIPAGFCVCHRCDVKLCVNPEHPFLGTISDNAVDMRRKDRHPAGLRWAEAVAAKDMLSAGYRTKDVAVRMGINPSTVSRMKHGHIYRSV
jgi:hypothetical protein